MATDLIVTEHVVIPGDELVAVAVRSSGPGGQNVNKVSTKVELRFDLANTTALQPGARARLLDLCRGRLDAEGRVVITSDATRNRIRNLADAREKLAALVREALVPPKARHATKPTRASKTRRVEDKRRRSAVKRTRGASGGDE